MQTTSRPFSQNEAPQCGRNLAPRTPTASRLRVNSKWDRIPPTIFPFFLFALLFLTAPGPALHAQMNPYFTAVSYPIPRDTMMVMLLPDYQIAQTGPNFVTGMAMVQYGITSRWTVGFMVEGQKISGMPFTYGGVRVNSYLRLFPKDHLLNFTVYGEYEGLNAAGLYKMEVAGFGGEDLSGPLSVARRTPAHTFEQRAIMYHDWGRTNLTFNFINETGLTTSGNDFGFALGIFRQPAYSGMGMAMGGGDKAMSMCKDDKGTSMCKDDKQMAGMPAAPPPPHLSLQRLGYGLEMIGALGDAHQFGFDWPHQQQYLGPVFSYSVSRNWNVRVETLVGLSGVSDPFVLRTGVSYSIDHFAKRLAHVF